MTRHTVTRIFQNRVTLLAILLVIEAQFFVINGLNSLLRDPSDGWELKIGIVDNHLTPEGLWLIPYTIGFFAAALVPLWAAYSMSNTLFRQYILSMALAAAFGYVIYILFPTYVTKPSPDDVRGSHFFAELLRKSYAADAAASTHNAAPSQHVFYAILNMVFVIRHRPHPRVFWTWVTLATLITCSALLTMRHNSPDIIAGYAVAVGAYYAGTHLGARLTAHLGDADALYTMPALGWVRRSRARIRRAARLTPVWRNRV